MRAKKTSSQVFEGIEPIVEAKKNNGDLDQLTIKIRLQDITLQQKIQEASRPLYLKRYE